MPLAAWFDSVLEKLTFTSLAFAAGGFLLNRYAKKAVDHAELKLLTGVKNLRSRWVRRRIQRALPIIVALRRSAVARAEALASWQRVRTDFATAWLSYLGMMALSYLETVIVTRGVYMVGAYAFLYVAYRQGRNSADFDFAYELEGDPELSEFIDGRPLTFLIIREHRAID